MAESYSATATAAGPRAESAQERIQEASRIALPFAGAMLGGVLIVIAFATAGTSPQHDGHYIVFWLGALLGTVSLGAAATKVEQRWRSLYIGGLGIFAFLPKFLRDPNSPVFKDELAHWSQTVHLYHGASPFQFNVTVPMASYFPGMHVLSAEISAISGLDIWHSSMLMLAGVHVISLLAVAGIASELWGSGRAGAFAAVVYAISPEFPFTDSFFTYESLAVPFALCALYAGLRASTTMPPRRAIELGLAMTLGLACVMTHHLTSYELVLVFAIMAAAAFLKAESHSARANFVVAAALGAGAIVWIIALGVPIFSYLAPFPRAAIHSVVPIFDRLVGARPPSSSQAVEVTTRSAFGGSALPIYEQVLGYLAPFVALAACIPAWFRRDNAKSDSQLAGWMVVAGLYFLSLPLILSPSASPGAHRSWAMTYVGVAVLCGAMATPRTRSRSENVVTSGAPAPPADTENGARAVTGRRSVAAIVAVAAVATLMLGNYAAAVNDSEMFPGATVIGADGRGISQQLVSMAKSFKADYGPGYTVVGDKDVLPVFEAYAGAVPPPIVSGAWRLFYSGVKGDLSTGDKYDLLGVYGIQFIVLDKEAVGANSLAPDMFASFQPASNQEVTQASLSQLEDMPGMTRIYSSNRYVILAFRPTLGSARVSSIGMGAK